MLKIQLMFTKVAAKRFASHSLGKNDQNRTYVTVIQLQNECQPVKISLFCALLYNMLHVARKKMYD